MKLSLIPASLVALGLFAGSGFAATATPMKAAPTAKAPATTAAPVMAQTDTSMIKAIDLKAHQLTLADGKMFTLPHSWKLHGYKTGEKVKVIYQDRMGNMTVTKISKV